MTSLADQPGPSPRTDVAQHFLDCLAVQDFDRLGADLADDVHLRALLPGDTREWSGPDRVKATFLRWFGNTKEFELVEASVDDLGSRVHMSWQARVRADRLGEGWFRVEQHAYVETDDHDLIRRIWLACSGYLAETPSG
jgi:ketosteroid isomerase-like protein